MDAADGMKAKLRVILSMKNAYRRHVNVHEVRSGTNCKAISKFHFYCVVLYLID